jgi:serine protease Do
MNTIDNNTKKISRKIPNALFIISVVFISLLSGVIGGSIVYNILLEENLEALSIPQQQTVVHEVTQLQDDTIVDMVENTTPAVVSIIAKKDVPQYRQLFNTPYGLFYQDPSQSMQKQKVGGGTGFFMTADGMIVTNRHVVADVSADYSVITSDDKEYQAEILAVDDTLDFAVLKITPKNGESFSAANLGNSDNIKIGQTVVAIGNSLGEFSHSVSRGIISGMKRDIVAGGGIGGAEQLTGIIQTDAAINPGNSGGPLIDLEGKVIGINTAIAQGAQNIGFAIPINQVSRLIDEVKRTGTISHPFIGVRYIAITPNIASELGMPYENGVVIVQGRNNAQPAVLPGSPADKVGIVENDVILQIDGVNITQEDTLAKEISKYAAGDIITLKVWHNGETKDVIITLEDKKDINKI